MMGFKEFLELQEAGEMGPLQESIMGGSPRAQLANARVAFKQNDNRLRQAWKALEASPEGDDLQQEVAGLKSAVKALVASDLHKSRELHLVVELLVATYESDQRQARRR